jgi:hypothetical protein
MRTWVAALLGVLLGALVQPTPNPKAQAYGSREIGVHVGKMNGTASDGMIPGSQVVGFSCVPDACYLASKD